MNNMTFLKNAICAFVLFLCNPPPADEALWRTHPRSER